MHKRTICIGVFSLLLCLCYSVSAQKTKFYSEIQEIASSKKVTIGFAALGIEDRDTLNYNANLHIAMQSVYKFPVALTVLDLIDKKTISSLDQEIFVAKEEMHPHTWSPLRDKYHHKDANIPLNEILFNSISHSDNNACDILFRLIGGTKIVDDYIKELGIKGISIAATVTEMRDNPDLAYQNWAQPASVLQLLDLFYRGKILEKYTTDFLKEVMVETTTGENRIKKLLPKTTIVAHKTGSSGYKPKGTEAVTNDIGIVTLPNGKHFAIVVMVSTTEESEADCEVIIAKVAKATYDYFNSKQY